MSKNKVIKSVSFNITNADDAAMLEAIKRRNFSGYVKKLIKEDLSTQTEKTAQNEPVEVEKEQSKPKELTASEKMAKMREQMKRAGKKTGPFIKDQNQRLN